MTLLSLLLASAPAVPPVPRVPAQEPEASLQLLDWAELPSLPDPIGFAGPFGGVSNGALVVAGGANFPGGRPWDGAAKVWHDRTLVLPAQDGAWLVSEPLPRPTAYGASATWQDAVVCAGGGDADEHFVAAYLLCWTGERLEREELPPLPAPTAFACAAVLDDVLYVAGGLSAPGAERPLTAFLSLDLAAPERAWRTLETWPGPPRMLAVLGVQEGAVFLFGGCDLDPALGTPNKRVYLSDAYRYRPTGGWIRVADLPRALAGAPTPAFAIGPEHLALVGGDTGELRHDTDVLRDAHPGFAPDVLLYHALADTWSFAGAFPKEPGPDPANDPNAGAWPAVTAPGVTWGERYVVPTGEVRPGVRSPRVFAARAVPRTARFGALDWTALSSYLLALVAMGFWFARREHTTDDFFLAGRRIPWWAAGVSIFGTQLSAITFMAIPAKAYATDWVYIVGNIGIVAIAPLVVYAYLPFFRGLEVTSAYEYLERRFALSLRLFGSAAFIAYQLARMGIVVLLPALALAAVTGLDVTACILVMGVLATAYTALGGIEAVIWTDVLQVVVLMGGALIALFVVSGGVEGGLGGAIELAQAEGKLRIVDARWDWTQATIGVLLVGAFFNNLVPYTTDQAVIQRYLTTANQRQAARAVWTNALLTIPASVLFFGLGTALFAFYRHHPAALDPTRATDQIFPWFIATELPAGISGILIAGIFAAAMSSLDSSMNSIATAGVTDFYRRFRRGLADAHCLRVARWLTVLLGALGTGAALAMARHDVRSLLDLFLSNLGLLGGSLAGLFALGIFTTRVGTLHAWIGVLTSAAALVYAREMTSLNGLVYAGIGAGSCFFSAILSSRVLPRSNQDVSGLTIWTRPRNPSSS